MRRDSIFVVRRAIAVLTLLGGLVGIATECRAVEGTELNASIGVWAPLLPDASVAPVTESGDSAGGIVGLSGHHRFSGYRTSIESNINYGFSEDAEMFGFDVLLRDTWRLGVGDVSAGGGYSYMDWQQDFTADATDGELNSQYNGGKIIGGWETAFGRRPVWLDLSLGLYDLQGDYVGNTGGSITTASINKFTTTYGIDVKTEFLMFSTPTRAFFGINFLDDITAWQNGAIGTDNAVVLTGGLEIRLY